MLAVDKWKGGPRPKYFDFVAFSNGQCDITKPVINSGAKQIESASTATAAVSHVTCGIATPADRASLQSIAAGSTAHRAEQLVEQGPDPTPPTSDPAALVGRSVWRLWDRYGWYRAEIDSFDSATHHHKLVFQKGTASELTELMNVLDAPVQLSWRDPTAKKPVSLGSLGGVGCEARSGQETGAAAGKTPQTAAPAGSVLDSDETHADESDSAQGNSPGASGATDVPGLALSSHDDGVAICAPLP